MKLILGLSILIITIFIWCCLKLSSEIDRNE